MFGRAKRELDSLKRIADALYDAVPFTGPEVVRFDDLLTVRLQSGSHEYLLVNTEQGQWATSSVIIDEATGEPDTSSLMQRIMRDSVRVLEVPNERDLHAVVVCVMQRLVIQWTALVEGDLVLEADRAYATEALSRLEARMQDPRPPLKP